MKAATTPQRPASQVIELDEDAPLLDQVIAETSRRLGRIAKRYSDTLQDNALDRLERAMMTAAAIDKLSRAISHPFMQSIMPLMNTRLGFKTDRTKGELYSEDTVKRCLIEALLHGVYPFGNEWNIIAGNLYITQEGYQRKVEEIDGLTDFELIPGVPTAHNGQTVIKMAARWKLNGVRQELRGTDGHPGRVFPIITHQGTSPDNIIGKGKRKALKAIYDQITGSVWTAPDGDAEDSTPAPAPKPEAPQPATRTGALEGKLAAAAGKNGGHKEEELPTTGEPSGKQFEDEPPVEWEDPGQSLLWAKSAIAQAKDRGILEELANQVDQAAAKFGPQWRAKLNPDFEAAWKRLADQE